MPVAIHGTVGNPPIMDATANSGDVVSGKVFYNNKGRQVGTKEDIFNLKTLVIHSSDIQNINKLTVYDTVTNILEYYGNTVNQSVAVHNLLQLEYNKTIEAGIKRIYALKINGKLYKASSISSTNLYFFNRSTNGFIERPDFFLHVETLYIGKFQKMKECTIYYE